MRDQRPYLPSIYAAGIAISRSKRVVDHPVAGRRTKIATGMQKTWRGSAHNLPARSRAPDSRNSRETTERFTFRPHGVTSVLRVTSGECVMRLTSVQMRNECSSHARHAHCGTSAETQYVYARGSSNGTFTRFAGTNRLDFIFIEIFLLPRFPFNFFSIFSISPLQLSSSLLFIFPFRFFLLVAPSLAQKIHTEGRRTFGRSVSSVLGVTTSSMTRTLDVKSWERVVSRTLSIATT